MIASPSDLPDYCQKLAPLCFDPIQLDHRSINTRPKEKSMYEFPLLAPMDDGTELPILDVTHPAFALVLTEEQIAAMMEEYARVMSRGVPPQIAEVLRQSNLGKALMGASGGFLAGLPTYQMKLGPDYLGSDASPIDRQIAGSPPAVFMRLRLQDIAQTLADALLEQLNSDRDKPILLVNIGGGVAADSWNALLFVHAARPDLLSGLRIKIAVLETDERGPALGRSAIKALSAPNAPFASLDLQFQHIPYDWSRAENLPPILEELNAAESVCVISSEGALFEYGSDAEIVANLRAIHTASPASAVIAGSVTRADARHPASNMAIRPRTLEEFRLLAGPADWKISRVVERPFSYNVALAKA